MIKLPVSARFLALTLIVSATTVLATNAFANKKAAPPEPGKEPRRESSKIKIDKCFAVLTKIPMAVATTFAEYPWSLGDHAEVTEVLLGSREKSNNPNGAATDQLIVRFSDKDYQVPVRTRFDALLIEHRGLFNPSIISTTFGGSSSPRISAQLELADSTDLDNSQLTSHYVLGPLTMAGVNEIVEISTLQSPDKSQSGVLIVKIRVGQMIHKVILASEIDSLIFLVTHRLGLPLMLSAAKDGKGYKARTYVASENPSSVGLLLKDYKIPASIIRTLMTQNDATTGDQVLKIQFADLTIPTTPAGDVNYTTIESRSEMDAIKTLESLISSEKVNLTIESSKHASGKGFTNIFKFDDGLAP